MRTVEGDLAMATVGLFVGAIAYLIAKISLRLNLWQRTLLAFACAALGIAVFNMLVGNV